MKRALCSSAKTHCGQQRMGTFVSACTPMKCWWPANHLFCASERAPHPFQQLEPYRRLFSSKDSKAFIIPRWSPPHMGRFSGAIGQGWRNRVRGKAGGGSHHSAVLPHAVVTFLRLGQRDPSSGPAPPGPEATRHFLQGSSARRTLRADLQE